MGKYFIKITIRLEINRYMNIDLDSSIINKILDVISRNACY